MEFSQKSYAEMLSELDDVKCFLEGLGLRNLSDRLGLSSKALETLEAAREAGAVDAFLKRKDATELVWAFVNAQEFIEIERGLRGYDSASLKPIMKKALRGPLLPSSETSYKSNLGRNTAFELRFGSRLRRAGGELHLGQRADLVVDEGGFRLYVECKRPFQSGTERSNVEEARGQLQERLNGDDSPLAVGLVALSASRSLNTGSKWFVVDVPESLHALGRDLLALHSKAAPDYDQLPDLRLIGNVYHVHAPAYIKSLGLLTVATESLVMLSGPALQSAYPLSYGEPLKDLLDRALRAGG